MILSVFSSESWGVAHKLVILFVQLRCRFSYREHCSYCVDPGGRNSYHRSRSVCAILREMFTVGMESPVRYWLFFSLLFIW